VDRGKMNIETLAKAVHDSFEKVVDAGLVLHREPCKFVEYRDNNHGGIEEVRCDNGILARVGSSGMLYDIIEHQDVVKCDHCGGSGFEPFTKWNDIPAMVQQGRLVMAKTLDDTYIIVPRDGASMDLETAFTLVSYVAGWSEKLYTLIPRTQEHFISEIKDHLDEVKKLIETVLSSDEYKQQNESYRESHNENEHTHQVSNH